MPALPTHHSRTGTCRSATRLVRIHPCRVSSWHSTRAHGCTLYTRATNLQTSCSCTSDNARCCDAASVPAQHGTHPDHDSYRGMPSSSTGRASHPSASRTCASGAGCRHSPRTCAGSRYASSPSEAERGSCGLPSYPLGLSWERTDPFLKTDLFLPEERVVGFEYNGTSLDA